MIVAHADRRAPLPRRRVLLRGPGALAGVLALAIAGTALAANVQLSASHRPQTAYSIVASPSRTAGNPDTQMRVQAGNFLVDPGTRSRPVPAGRIWLLIDLTFANAAHRAAPIDRRSFYAVTGSGQTYVASTAVPEPGMQMLGTERLKPHGIAHGWIAFLLPARSQSVQVIWNDANQLLPPATLLTTGIRRVTLPGS